MPLLFDDTNVFYYIILDKLDDILVKGTSYCSRIAL